MCNVDGLHEKVSTSNDSLPFRCRPTVDRYVFTYRVIVADFGGRIFTFELQVLGNRADDSTWKNSITVSHARSA